MAQPRKGFLGATHIETVVNNQLLTMDRAPWGREVIDNVDIQRVYAAIAAISTMRMSPDASKSEEIEWFFVERKGDMYQIVATGIQGSIELGHAQKVRETEGVCDVKFVTDYRPSSRIRKEISEKSDSDLSEEQTHALLDAPCFAFVCEVKSLTRDMKLPCTDSVPEGNGRRLKPSLKEREQDREGPQKKKNWWRLFS